LNGKPKFLLLNNRTNQPFYGIPVISSCPGFACARLNMDKKEKEIVDRAIDHWLQQQIIDAATAQRMRAGWKSKSSPGHVLATYALIACVSCSLLAFGALVMDEKWLEWLRQRFEMSEIFVSILFFGLTALFFWMSRRRLKRRPESVAGNEAFHITLVLSLSVALAYAGRSMGDAANSYTILLLAAVAIFAFMSVLLQSRLLWVVMMCTLAGWWGAQTYRWSGGADYFLGMNYALRMTLFGSVLLLLPLLLRNFTKLQIFKQASAVFAWIAFLLAAWTLSILGNSSSVDVWMQVRQGSLWYWAVAFTALLVGLAVYAFKTGYTFLRDVTLVFFMINIYTRYFEYFWDSTNKGLFFAILAVSFWWLGRTAEKWRKRQDASLQE
jgi:hypothetical protein